MPDYRVYFNRKAEAPQVWSVDEGDQNTELNVIGFYLHGVRAVSQWNGIKPNPDSPSAWLDVLRADLEVVRGIAHFYPVETSYKIQKEPD